MNINSFQRVHLGHANVHSRAVINVNVIKITKINHRGKEGAVVISVLSEGTMGWLTATVVKNLP